MYIEKSYKGYLISFLRPFYTSFDPKTVTKKLDRRTILSDIINDS